MRNTNPLIRRKGHETDKGIQGIGGTVELSTMCMTERKPGKENKKRLPAIGKQLPISLT